MNFYFGQQLKRATTDTGSPATLSYRKYDYRLRTLWLMQRLAALHYVGVLNKGTSNLKPAYHTSDLDFLNPITEEFRDEYSDLMAGQDLNLQDVGYEFLGCLGEENNEGYLQTMLVVCGLFLGEVDFVGPAARNLIDRLPPSEATKFAIEYAGIVSHMNTTRTQEGTTESYISGLFALPTFTNMGMSVLVQYPETNPTGQVVWKSPDNGFIADPRKALLENLRFSGIHNTDTLVGYLRAASLINPLEANGTSLPETACAAVERFYYPKHPGGIYRQAHRSSVNKLRFLKVMGPVPIGMLVELLDSSARTNPVGKLTLALRDLHREYSENYAKASEISTDVATTIGLEHFHPATPFTHTDGFTLTAESLFAYAAEEDEDEDPDPTREPSPDDDDTSTPENEPPVEDEDTEPPEEEESKTKIKLPGKSILFEVRKASDNSMATLLYLREVYNLVTFILNNPSEELDTDKRAALKYLRDEALFFLTPESVKSFLSEIIDTVPEVYE